MDGFKETFLHSRTKKCIYTMSLVPSLEPEMHILTEAPNFTHIDVLPHSRFFSLQEEAVKS